MIKTDSDTLAMRARALAKRVRHDDAEATALVDVVRARIGDSMVAIPLDAVIGITRVLHVTPLPGAVAPVYGITAWRGRPITVLSLDRRAPTGQPEQRMLLLGESQRATLAVLVDEVDDSVTISREQAATAADGVLAAFSRGLTADSLLVLDIERITRAARSDIGNSDLTQRNT